MATSTGKPSFDYFRAAWTSRIGLFALLTLVSLGLGLWAANADKDWREWWSALTGVAGFLVGLIGFAITIWTIYETKRASHEAEQKVADAMSRAETAAKETRRVVRALRKETRLAGARVQQQMGRVDLSDLLMFERELRQAAESLNWHRALIRTEDCSRLLARVGASPDIQAKEQRRIKTISDELGLIREFIRDSRMNQEPGTLREKHFTTIENLIHLLQDIQGRDLYSN